MKKYTLRQDLFIEIFGRKLFRIQAEIDIPRLGIKKGDLGGYIESEKNLNQSSDAQVSGDAWVYGDARVSGNSLVSGNAWVYGNARVFGDARVYGDAQVFGNAWVYDNAQVFGDAQVYGNAQVSVKMILKTKHDHINILGIRFSTTISLTGINVGCKHYTDLKDFESRYIQEGKDNNYSDIELKYLCVSIKNGLKLIKEMSK